MSERAPFDMTFRFSSLVRNLPRADIPFDGVEAYLLQGPKAQVVLMSFAQDVSLPKHAHGAQWGVVLEGMIEMVIDGQPGVYTKGDQYFIPAGVEHWGRIHAGYADITLFEEARYSAVDKVEP